MAFENRHFWQKVLVVGVLGCVNGALIALSIIFNHYWYIFLIPLSFATTFNAMCVILIVVSRLTTKKTVPEVSAAKNVGFIVPCYNETREELSRTFDSLSKQTNIGIHNKVMFILCDGRAKSSGETHTTDYVLTNEILKDYITSSITIVDAYNCWDGSKMTVDVVCGVMNGMPFMCIIKHENMGKRDSLVCIRGLSYDLGNEQKEHHNIFSSALYDQFDSFCNTHNISKLDYVIGTDADTEFKEDCSYHLIKSIDCDANLHGVVGFVSISSLCPKWNIFTIYQNTEYIVAQCLRRLQQSLITKKVSCLSGCCQILRVSKETSGKEILDAFNYFPKQTDDIFKHIRSFASEDRNHVCLMLSLFPHVKTGQCLEAVSYTIVPMNVNVFRSQRRRWSLGASCNDILLTYMKGINIYERIGAIINIVTYSLCSFVFASTVLFGIAIFTFPNIIMLYLCIIMFVPTAYNISIVFWFPFDNLLDRIRYLVGYTIYLFLGPIINIMIHFYSVLNMDCFKWGKTRAVAENTTAENATEIVVQ